MTELSATAVTTEANITHRQLDWWITHHAIPTTDKMGNTGSGFHRRIPAWYIPRLRLLGEIQRAFGSKGQGGLEGTKLRQVFDAYYDGTITFGLVTLSWTPEPYVGPWHRCTECGEYFGRELHGPCEDCA